MENKVPAVVMPLAIRKRHAYVRIIGSPARPYLLPMGWPKPLRLGTSYNGAIIQHALNALPVKGPLASVLRLPFDSLRSLRVAQDPSGFYISEAYVNLGQPFQSFSSHPPPKGAPQEGNPLYLLMMSAFKRLMSE